MKGYDILEAQTLEEGKALVASEKPGLIVLDVMLPDGSGIDLCKELRQDSDIPILFLTALGQESEIVQGLRAGGDDYLPKSYGLDVLVAKVEALLRRSVQRMPDVITKGGLVIKLSSSEVFINGEKKRLPQNEMSLLIYFAKNENRIMSGEYLYEQVWGQPMVGDNSAVKNIVYRLRKTLENSEFTITCRRGEGYCFEKV